MEDIWSDSNVEPSKKKKLIWLYSFLLFILINVCSLQGWLGPTNAEVSKRFETVLTPTGWTFSIWGIIFLLQGAGTLYLFLQQGYDPDGYKQRYVNGLFGPLLGFWASASLWQICFVRQSPTGMLLAGLCLFSGLAAMGAGMMRLYQLRASFGSPDSILLYICYMLPASICTAWLSVAFGVQCLIVSAYQVASGSEDYVAIGLLTLVTIAGSWFLLVHKDTAYGFTLLWAFVGVYEATSSNGVKHITTFYILVILLGCLVSVLRRKRPEQVELVQSEVQPLIQKAGAVSAQENV
jgi:hypothetical protein